ncbi:hypothetical protein OF377_00975 [Ureaplasma sp. ES3154-GEN]|uniref:Vmc-like lipoprotein signal peptide domain-containing protein n=1 Tax=Ureaplasma sp. ES3154-GEN TaxID=2984844 RepID=UPI0021E98A2A|nr:hypothetical protein [Ureaplasma sp. ES3154-GEN]MCV3743460.1 hypothetical protein [Ureaplasma sp. ES3154-GEN]
MQKNKKIKYKFIGLLSATIALSASIVAVATSCSTTEIGDVLFRKLEPNYKLTSEYQKKKVTAKYALDHFAKNEQNPLNYTILEIVPPILSSSDGIDPKLLSYSIVTKPHLVGEKNIYFEIEIKYNKQTRIKNFVIDNYITANELDVLQQKTKNLKLLNDAIEENKTLNLDMFGVRIKDQYKTKNLSEIKELGNEALILNINNPSMEKVQTYKAQAPFKDLKIQITDLQFYNFSPDYNEQKLSVEITISIGEQKHSIRTELKTTA